MSQQSRSAALPPALDSKLRSIRRRMLLIRAAGGLFITTIVLLSVMMTAMMIDWSVVLFNTGWRQLLTASSLLIAGIVFYRCCVRVLLRKLRLPSRSKKLRGFLS